MIRIGPAGLGAKIGEAAASLQRYSEQGLKACEIPFTYGIFIDEVRHKKEISEIRETCKKFDIKLSIHSPYWINLNSKEARKIEESKSRILGCCKIGELLGAEVVVFHAGFYGKDDKEISYLNIKKAVMEMLQEIEKNNWKIKIAAETMGKINIFGSSEEIIRLVKETGCSFCLDFAHLWAREKGKISYEEIYEKFKNLGETHGHFSGIVYGDKGEKSHKETPREEARKLLKALPKNKNITIINEAPNPIQDSLMMLEVFKEVD